LFSRRTQSELRSTTSNTHRRILNTSTSGQIDELLMTSELPALWMEEPPIELPSAASGAPSTLKTTTAAKTTSGSTRAAAASKSGSKATSPSNSTAKKPNPSNTTAKAKAKAAPATLPVLTQASLKQATQSQSPSSPPPRGGPGSEVDSEVGSLPEVGVSLHHQPRPTTKPLGLHRSATRAEDILKPPPFQQYYGTASTLRPKAFFQAADAHKVCVRVYAVF